MEKRKNYKEHAKEYFDEAFLIKQQTAKRRLLHDKNIREQVSKTQLAARLEAINRYREEAAKSVTSFN